jgi:hypothetical protein
LGIDFCATVRIIQKIMRRSTIIILGTWLGGVAIYACVIKLFGLAPREPDKTTAFISSFVAAGIVSTLATWRMAKSSKPTENFTIEEMEQRGLLLREQHEAARAFQVEEFEDEGCQYIIELKNGAVLYLCGQYLYDYEPMEGARKQARKFPCTEFTVLRDKRHGWVVDVVCGGKVLEPEIEVPPFTVDDHETGRAPADGDIISDRSYDQIKQEWMKSSRK